MLPADSCPIGLSRQRAREAMSKVEDVAGESDFKTLNRWIMDHTTDMEARARALPPNCAAATAVLTHPRARSFVRSSRC